MALVYTFSELLDNVGPLDDSPGDDTARERFRRTLRQKIHEVSQLRDSVEECLTNSGDQFNKALQDLVNRIGELLGFDVKYGRYRGVAGEIGFDGLWCSPEGRAIVAEVKTTDVYKADTHTLLGYINALVSGGQIKKSSDALGLYVYGRFDERATQLENAIVVEGRRDLLRVISVSALLDLLTLRQEYNLDHTSILSLLLPTPVRVDPLVRLIFDVVAREVEVQEVKPSIEVPPQEVDSQGREQEESPAAHLVQISDDYKGTTARSVVFQGKRYEAHSWKEAMLALFEVLRGEDQKKFEAAALTLVGRRRPYITRDRDALRVPQLIPNTVSLYVETNLSANHIVKLCYTLITRMGYKETLLTFEIEQ